MDDDKQVKDLTTQTTIGRFLSKPVLPDEKDKEQFDLEREFAKSAKNKSPIIPLAVAVFLILLAIGAWVASQFTEQASQKSSVSIGSFEDLKLKEIFDTARKNKKDLEAIQGQMDELTQETNARIVALTQSGNSKADIASVNDASGAQAKAILAETAKKISAEKAALAVALRPLKTQADEVQKKIDSYDDRIGQMNKKNQQVLDTQQRLFDLEKKKLIGQYEARLEMQTEEAVATLARVKQERDNLVAAMKAKQADDIRKLILKYNPVIADGFLQAWIAQDGAAPAAAPLLAFPDRIETYGLVTQDLKTAFAARVDRTQQLLARLRAIPYINSVPGLLNALDKAINDSLVGYNGYLVPLAAHMDKLDGVIADRDATIEARDATIVERDTTIAERDATIVEKNDLIAQLEAKIAGLQNDLLVAAAERKAAEAAEALDRAAELASVKAADSALLNRWVGGMVDYLATLKEDGLFIDIHDSNDWLVLLKADRAKAVLAAVDAAAAAPPPAPPAPGKTAPVVVPPNQASVRDSATNAELGTVTLEVTSTGAWRARLVKLTDPKKPFKSFDRLVLSLPVPKK